METFSKQKILENIGKVYEEANACKLKEPFFQKVEPELTYLSGYFGTTKNQAFIIAMVYSLNYMGDTVDLQDLIGYFQCNPMKLLEYSDDFKHLHAAGILTVQKSRHRMALAGNNDQFTICEEITEAILSNQAMPVIQQADFTDPLDVLEKVYNLINSRSEEKMPTKILLYWVTEILSKYNHLPIIRYINDLKLDSENTCLYIYIIWKTLTGQEKMDISQIVDTLIDNAVRHIKYMQDFLSGKNSLIELELAEIINSTFFNDADIKLTENSERMLAQSGLTLLQQKKKSDNLIAPADIPERELIFSESEMKQLFLLTDLLQDVKLKETQQRLMERNMPRGVTVLLHGAPGTGKTEIVKQLARQTGRELMKVDISKSKSAWFGESEKVIKQIFNDFKSYAKNCERIPILLFNEADGIFSKRKDPNSSNVAQTENAIQNIILEELENFEGILIATTNLANNLDAAFERRFLFKIHFPQPAPHIRAQIWQLKFPALSIKECTILAEKFNFSGGQIDNIARKKEIQEIIHGEEVSLEKIQMFCAEETLTGNRKTIGFYN